MVAELFEVDQYDKDHAFLLDYTTHIYFVLRGTVGIYDPCQAPSLHKKEKPKSRYSTKNENVRVVVPTPPTAALADARNAAATGKNLTHAYTAAWEGLSDSARSWAAPRERLQAARHTRNGHVKASAQWRRHLKTRRQQQQQGKQQQQHISSLRHATLQGAWWGRRHV
jgi:hypothetical protein